MEKLFSGLGATATEPLTIAWLDVQRLVDEPTKLPKDQAQWLIPSSYQSRSFKDQKQHGRYWLCTFDFDEHPPQIQELAKITREILEEQCFECCDFELYNTNSATVDNHKSRLFIPLTKLLNFKEWLLLQQVIAAKFEQREIVKDSSLERAGQVSYLPNGIVGGDVFDKEGNVIGKRIYFSESERNSGALNPELFRNEMNALADELQRQEDELKTEKAKALAARSMVKKPTSNDSRNLIDAFNQCYDVASLLTAHGYDQIGNRFRHPNSKSGKYKACILNGRVHTFSQSDPLNSNGKGAHDAFSVFTVLEHGGYVNEALKNAGDNFLTIDGVAWNKVVQREFMQEQQINANIQVKSENTNKPNFSLSQFSLNGTSATMREQMLNTTYVLNSIAIMGQHTTIYAKPNTGKTLLVIWLLVDAIKKEKITGDKVFYVNADDTYNGLIEKLTIAEKYGFQMIAPNEKKFNSNLMLDYIQAMTSQKTAHGVVIVLDTLKKFTDPMDKKKASLFGKIAREFVLSGGTLITLSHTNKNRNADGKVVFGGTSDIVDDCDCAFTLDEVPGAHDEKNVLFENFKRRGNVADKLVFSYSPNLKSYEELFESVKSNESEQEITDVANKVELNHQIEHDKYLIDAIINAIKNGIHQRTQLIEFAALTNKISKPRLTIVLDKYVGLHWKCQTGLKNSKSYFIEDF